MPTFSRVGISSLPTRRKLGRQMQVPWQPMGRPPVILFDTDPFFLTHHTFRLRVVVHTFGFPLKVGRALKSVDARLLSDWTAWTGGHFPPAHCQVSKTETTIAQMHFSAENGRITIPDSRTLSAFRSPFLFLV